MEIKSYDEFNSLDINKEDRDKFKAKSDKRKRKSKDTSPRSQTSPVSAVSTSSLKMESLESNSPGPDNDKKQREMDLKKHWKKRKLVQESGSGEYTLGKITPTPEPDRGAQHWGWQLWPLASMEMGMERYP